MSKRSVARTSADPTIAKVLLEVRGKRLQLAFDFNAIARAEMLTGLNLLKAMDFQGLSASQFRALLFAAALKFQPKITIEEAGELVGPDTAELLTDKLVETFSVSRPEPKKDEESPNAEAPTSN